MGAMNAGWGIGRHDQDLVFTDGRWYYDAGRGEFGYRPESFEPVDWREFPWHFPGPDRYPELAAASKPGLLAPSWEKALHSALVGGDPSAIRAVGGQHPAHRPLADLLAGLMQLATNRAAAKELLAAAYADGFAPEKDPFIRRYLPEAGVTVPVAPGVVVEQPLRRTAIALALAELHQATGDLDDAVAVLQATDRTTHVRLSLAEILFQAGRFDEVVEVTEGIFNDEDVTALTLVFRAAAFRRLGRLDDATTAIERALAYENRSAPVLRFARMERARIAAERGDSEAARADVEAILAEEPDHPPAVALRDHLADGSGSGSEPAT